MTAHQQTCSIASIIEQAVIALSNVSDSAKLDAQLLLAFVLNKNVTYLLTWPDKQLTLHEFSTIQQLLVRRVNGEPIAYIIGEKEFWSLPLKVSPATLIPRPDTEILVEQALEIFTENVHDVHCLDLGTGTGAIALALASEHNNWHIDAVDFNQQAVELAQENAQQLNLAQVTIYQSDWFAQVNKEKQFDLIVSNPPYIDENDPHLKAGDVRFEPKSALVANDEGLSDIILIAKKARCYLKVNGYLLFEHGYQQGSAVRTILAELGYTNIYTVTDLANHERVTQGSWRKG